LPKNLVEDEIRTSVGRDNCSIENICNSLRTIDIGVELTVQDTLNKIKRKTR